MRENSLGATKKAQKLTEEGIKAKDALHIACAIYAIAEYFLTTDDSTTNKLPDCKDIFNLESKFVTPAAA